VRTDLSGGLNGVICDTAANPQTGIAGLSPALLGQEMLHGYGLQHSRHDGSETDYLDPWDVMSNAGPYMAPHPFLAADSERRYVVGPGLNAANADSMGWLSGLLWTNSTQEYAAIVKLRPLFRDDLPGWAAARVGDVYFEFRTKEAWDAAIPRPCVLAHRFSDTHSYIIDSSVLVSGSGAVQENEEFLPGQSFQLGSPTAVAGMGPWTRVSVMSIEPEVATLSVQVHADHRPVIGPGILLGGVASDGGGVVILNGKVIQIGPRSPEEGLVTAVAQLAAARDVAPQVRIAARRAALVDIMAKAQSGIADIDASHSPNLHFKARPSP
jgi:hypothetical protein